MERAYYIIKLQLDHELSYLIWFADEEDGLLTLPAVPHPKILAFKDENTLLVFVQEKQILLQEEETALYNLDTIAAWIKNPSDRVDGHLFLCIWNLFTDIATSLDIDFSGDQKGVLRNKVYDKLFFGTNTYGITPHGEYYIPQWTKAKLDKIAEVLDNGISIIRKHLQEAV